MRTPIVVDGWGAIERRDGILTGNPEIAGDDQHGAFQAFRPPFEDIHQYVTQYLDDR
ncbi:hypothetical protein ABNG03_03705 [Halorubrum sp. RMP-47]|uniref:hypothetical protein n=1 Tax=Halorubrum miltondacostae TaxID=3076378 RepID=UPI003527AA45